jgi:hypothetical protein
MYRSRSAFDARLGHHRDKHHRRTPACSTAQKKPGAFHCDSHPDSALFNNLPGAGKQLAPRLLTAFGSHRERFQCSLEALTFFGLAPVTEQSGKSKMGPLPMGLSQIPAPILP